MSPVSFGQNQKSPRSINHARALSARFSYADKSHCVPSCFDLAAGSLGSLSPTVIEMLQRFSSPPANVHESLRLAATSSESSPAFVGSIAAMRWPDSDALSSHTPNQGASARDQRHVRDGPSGSVRTTSASSLTARAKSFLSLCEATASGDGESTVGPIEVGPSSVTSNLPKSAEPVDTHSGSRTQGEERDAAPRESSGPQAPATTR